MPILVVCPGCGAKMNAPDTSAGRKVRCPRPECKTITTVPAPSGRPALLLDQSPFDLGDDEGDSPRRGQARGGSGGKTGVVAALVLGVVVLVGGAGYGVYRLAGGAAGPPEPVAVPAEPKAAVPAGWREYTSAEDGFRAYFPKDVEKSGGGVPGAPEVGAITEYTSGGPDDPVQVGLLVNRFPTRNARAEREQMARLLADPRQVGPGGPKGKSRPVRWVGEQATEVVHPLGVTRTVLTDKAMFEATVYGKGGRAKPEEAAFFDNFSVK